jgi:hypothetical protein
MSKIILALTILASLSASAFAGGICDDKKIIVYIPGDGFRPTLNILEDNTIYVFPTQGVSEDTICKVMGHKQGCFAH